MSRTHFVAMAPKLKPSGFSHHPFGLSLSKPGHTLCKPFDRRWVNGLLGYSKKTSPMRKLP